MADTQRSISDILTLLADNTSGSISPQDHRDEVVTMRAGHGEIYVSTPAATSFSDSTSYVMGAGTYSLSSGAHNWAMSTNGQLKYTGVADRVVHVAASMSMSSSAANMVPYVAVYKNEAILTPSIIIRKLGGAGDIGSSALHATTTVSTNDYITIRIRNSTWTTSQTITLDTCNVFATDMAS